ncbi:UNVERIFIED_CONTAM: hypothetical protein K2H54_031279 [Gekko kuhli]
MESVNTFLTLSHTHTHTHDTYMGLRRQIFLQLTPPPFLTLLMPQINKEGGGAGRCVIAQLRLHKSQAVSPSFHNGRVRGRSFPSVAELLLAAGCLKAFRKSPPLKPTGWRRRPPPEQTRVPREAQGNSLWSRRLPVAQGATKGRGF